MAGGISGEQDRARRGAPWSRGCALRGPYAVDFVQMLRRNEIVYLTDECVQLATGRQFLLVGESAGGRP